MKEREKEGDITLDAKERVDSSIPFLEGALFSRKRYKILAEELGACGKYMRSVCCDL